MRLLRLISENNSNLWDTQFNESIIVEPNSKIAVNNLSAQLKALDAIRLLNQNFSVYYGGNIVNYNLNDNYYDRNNYQDLLNEINLGINNALQYDETSPYLNNIATYCSEFNISVQGYNILVQLKRTPQIEYYFIDKATTDMAVANINDPVSASVYFWDDPSGNANGNPTASFDHRFVSQIEMIKGNGFMRAQVDTLIDCGVAVDTQGFEIVLSKSSPSSLASNMTTNEADYGIGISYDSGVARVYYRIKNTISVYGSYTVEINTTPNEFKNTVVELFRNGTDLEFAYWTSAGVRNVIHTETIVSSDTYHGVLVMHANEIKVKAKRVSLIVTPYTKANISNAPLVQYWNCLEPVPNVLYDGTINMSNDIANYLGMLPITASYDLPYIYISAPSIFAPLLSTRNLILDLQNLNINSYDSSQKQRKNIISGVLSENNESIVVSKENLIFIDLLNSAPLDIRNLKIRLLDQEYNNVGVNGKAILTLLIKGPNEA